MKNALKYIASIYLALLFCSSAHSLNSPAIIHVSLNGNDNWPGTEAKPKRSIHAGLDALRGFAPNKRELIIGRGVWHLDQPISLTNRDSGLRLTGKEGAIISGAYPIRTIQRGSPGIKTIAITGDLEKWHLSSIFFDDTKARLSSHPQLGFLNAKPSDSNPRREITLLESLGENFDDDGDALLLTVHEWSISLNPIASYDEGKGLLKTRDQIGRFPPHYQPGYTGHKNRYRILNSVSHLRQPGSWAKSANSITYIEPTHTLNSSYTLFGTRVSTLLVIEGTSTDFARDISVQGITFTHTGWSIPKNTYASGQASFFDSNTSTNEIEKRFPPSAIAIKNADNIKLQNLSVLEIDAGGIHIAERTSNVELSNSKFINIGGNGIQIGQPNDHAITPDSAHCEKTGNPKNITVVGNLVSSAGLRFSSAVAIWTGIASNVQIQGNTLNDSPYTAISIGWRWDSLKTCAGAINVEGNVIHRSVTELSDGAAIYTLGNIPNSHIVNNVISDVAPHHGRSENNGIYFDQGSSGIVAMGNFLSSISDSGVRTHKASSIEFHDNFIDRCSSFASLDGIHRARTLHKVRIYGPIQQAFPCAFSLLE